MRLSTRITVAVTVIAPLMVLAAGALLTAIVTHDLRTQQDDRLRASAAAVATTARQAVNAATRDRPTVQASAERSLSASALDLGIRLEATDLDYRAGPQPPLSFALPKPTDTIVSVSDGGSSWQALGQSLVIGTSGEPAVLWTFSSDSPTQTATSSVIRGSLLVALLTAPVAALTAVLATRRATRSLRALQARTAGLDPGVRESRVAHTRSGVTEVDALAHTLDLVLTRYDEQAARTDQALTTARSFAATASHELRTPLMSMQTNLEILSEHADLDPEERGEILTDLHHAHQRLLGSLTLLRALAQGDLVEAAQFEPVDLTEMAVAAVTDARRADPDAVITIDAWTPAVLHGWEPGLRLVLDNLLTNALVHGSNPGTPTRVDVALRVITGGVTTGGMSAGTGGPTVALTVDDFGSGIPPDDRQRVFELFHRRSDSPGSGLGLTLIAQQVALHGGLIGITDPPTHPGTRFEIHLPLDHAPTTTMPLPGRRDWLTDTTYHLVRPAEAPVPAG